MTFCRIASNSCFCSSCCCSILLRHEVNSFGSCDRVSVADGARGTEGAEGTRIAEGTGAVKGSATDIAEGTPSDMVGGRDSDREVDAGPTVAVLEGTESTEAEAGSSRS